MSQMGLPYIIMKITDHRLIVKIIIDTVNSTSKLDTFYIQKNENNKNIFIEFYKKENNEFKLIDWKRIFDEQGCRIDFIDSP